VTLPKLLGVQFTVALAVNPDKRGEKITTAKVRTIESSKSFVNVKPLPRGITVLVSDTYRYAGMGGLASFPRAERRMNTRQGLEISLGRSWTLDVGPATVDFPTSSRSGGLSPT
jgi:hypothetical protein